VAQLEVDVGPFIVVEDDVSELVEDLRGLGHEATVRPAAEVGWAFQTLEVVIRLAEQLADEAIVAIVAVTIAWIRRVAAKRRHPRAPSVRIYGPDGEVLREVEVDVEPEIDD
jgi:hypothetical protein